MKTISYIELRLLISETGEEGAATKTLDAYISFPPTEPQDVQFHPILSTLVNILKVNVANWTRENDT